MSDGIPESVVSNRCEKLKSALQSLPNGQGVISAINEIDDALQGLPGVWNTNGGQAEYSRLQNVLSSITNIRDIASSVESIKGTNVSYAKERSGEYTDFGPYFV